MDENIVRPPQPNERRPTAELPEQRLYELLHDPAHDDVEAKLELIDAHPMIFPESTPDSLPRMSSPRLAHAPRREMPSGAVPTVPARPDSSTLASPRAPRPAPSTTARPRAQRPALPATEMSSTERPTVPSIPLPAVPALASSEAKPRPVMARQELPPIIDAPSDAPSKPPLDAATPAPSLLQGGWRARLILPIVLVLLALGAAALLLR